MRGIFFFIVCLFFWSDNPLATTLKEDLKVVKDICYGESVNDRNIIQPLLMDMYKKPENVKLLKPVIILVHGGGFNLGDKQQDLYIKMARTFAAEGYVSFSINYRLTTHKCVDLSVLENAVADVIKAIQWIKAHSKEYGIDPEKIIIAGDSAGGGIVVNAAYSTFGRQNISGCIDLWGGLSFNRLNNNINHWGEPINYYPIAIDVPPTCIIHGDKDEVIPFYTSEHLKEKLDELNIYNELHVLKDALHYPEAMSDEFIPIMLRFANYIVKK